MLSCWCRLADRPLSARIPPPIGRKRPGAEATRLTGKRQRQNGVTIPDGFEECQQRHTIPSPFSLTRKQLVLITEKGR